MKEKISSYISKTHSAIESIEKITDEIENAVSAITDSVRNGGKILVFGNGGSAADSQHISTELISRFRRERKPIPAISLTTNTSLLTAVSNDYSFDDVFSLQVEALGRENDTAIAISTSGNSASIIKAAQTARQMGIKVIALTGAGGGELASNSDILLEIDSDVTSHVQEGHLAVYHMICMLVEDELG